MAKRSRTSSLCSSDHDADSPSTRAGSIEPPRKLSHMHDSTPDPTVMTCYLPPHEPLSFPTLTAYETHYAAHHTHRCHTCDANFPLLRYLELHIIEHHDPISAVLKSRDGKIYKCLVEGCEKVCSTAQKRRLHCIDKHQFPKWYDFWIIRDGDEGRALLVNRGIKGQSARQGNRKSEAAEEPAAEIPNDTMEGLQEKRFEIRTVPGFAEKADTKATQSLQGAITGDPMEGLTSELDALKFIPSSVRFGRGKGRGRGRGRGGFSTS